MLDGPARPRRRAGRVFGHCFVRWPRSPGEKNAGHDVEAVSKSALRFGRAARQPGARAVSKTSLFAQIHGLGGLAVAGGAACFDLDENEHRAPPHDQIEFDAIGADVARDDAITSLGEIASGGVFAEAPER